MYLFINFDSYLVNMLVLIFFFLIMLYYFGKKEQSKVVNEEKAFRQRIYKLIGKESLPLYKGENIVNWSKVYNLLKEVPPSQERDEVMEIVRERRDNQKITELKQIIKMLKDPGLLGQGQFVDKPNLLSTKS